MRNTFFSTLWSSLPSSAIVIDEKNLIFSVNPRAESFFNSSDKLLRGEPIWDKLFLDSPFEEALVRVRKSESALFISGVDLGTGDRAFGKHNVRISTLVDRTGYLLIMFDSLDVSDIMGGSFQKSKSANSAIGMAEMLSHEIKNPLAGITGAAQLLSMNLSREEIELTDLIVGESKRIVKLLEQVNQFGNLSLPSKRSVNIHDILSKAKTIAKIGFSSNMKIKEEYDPSLPNTTVDPDQILQVLLNLLKNSCESSLGKDGLITIRTFYDKSLKVINDDGQAVAVPLQIEVQDDGPGVPEGLISRAFDPCVSGKVNGTGLGLALVSKIVTDHGGWITLSSIPGRTVFRISLSVNL